MNLLLAQRVKFASQTDSVVVQVSSKYFKLRFIIQINFGRQSRSWIKLSPLVNKMSIFLECEDFLDCDGDWNRCTNGLCNEFK